MDVMDELFAPPVYEWKRLSPELSLIAPVDNTDLRRDHLRHPRDPGLGTDRTVVGLGDHPGPGRHHLGRPLALIGRTWRSWGYVEREDDLYITHGVLFRSLVAVPYGRMQLVEVASGPLERAFGLATVTMKTASAETNATIPGLTPDEAARLRDRLTELGEAHASGL